MIARPDVGSNKVVWHLIRVVFPAPLGPSKPKISPGLISSEIPLRASTLLASLLNRPLRCLMLYVLTNLSTSTAPSMLAPVPLNMALGFIMHHFYPEHINILTPLYRRESPAGRQRHMSFIPNTGLQTHAASKPEFPDTQ